MFRRWAKLILPPVLLLAGLLAALFSNFSHSPAAPASFETAAREVQAACQDPGTQWMVVVCLVSYLVTFLVLEKRSEVSGLKSKVAETSIIHHPSSPRRTGISYLLSPNSYLPIRISSPNFWLVGFVTLVLLRYALDYLSATRSLQVVVLLTGLVFGKAVALWAMWKPSLKSKVQGPKPTADADPSTLSSAPAHSIFHRRSSIILCLLTLLLAFAALWHPERGMDFRYRGQTRWTGPWDNPNLFGLLMGVGFVLALGLFVQRLKSKVQSGASASAGRGTPCPPSEPATRNSERATGVTLHSPRGSTLAPTGGEGRGEGASGFTGAPPSSSALGVARSKAGGVAGAPIQGEDAALHLRPSTAQATHWLRAGQFLLSAFLFSAFGLCAYGLIKSYSRGAWLGTAVGLGFFIWKWIHRDAHRTHGQEDLRETPLPAFGHPLPVGRGEGWGEGCSDHQPPTNQTLLSRSSCISRLRGNLFPSAILIFSILVLSFWQFRHTESPLLRRVFSVGNINDFSWRNRVAAWQGAGRMMWDRPLVGFGWRQAEETYSKQYRPARLEESAAIQMNDFLMLGISAGVPALGCLLVYFGLVFRRSLVGRDRPLPAEPLNDHCGAHGVSRPPSGLRPSTLAPIGGENSPNHDSRFEPRNPLTRPEATLSPGGGEGWGEGALPFAKETQALSQLTTQPATELQTFGFRLQTAAVAAASAIVLLIGFWFDGGLFKLPTAVVFWTLLELARVAALREPKVGPGSPLPAGGGASVLASRLVGSLAPPEPSGAHGVTRPTLTLRWLAGFTAALALSLTALHLITPQLPLSTRTLAFARRCLVPPGEKLDFDFLATKPVWTHHPLKLLLQHAHLANYNRALVNWKLDDALYREFVLSPELIPSPGLPTTLSPSDGERAGVRGASSALNPQPSFELSWRRPLWEFFYPRVRKETSLQAAAEIALRQLRERIQMLGEAQPAASVLQCWERGRATESEFAVLSVAALRSVGIPARLGASGVEFWSGSEWQAVAPPPRKGK